MKPSEPHARSRELRCFRPSRKRAGIFSSSVVFLDAALVVLGFFVLVSPFVMQPGVNIRLPSSPFSGGARFGSMVLSITHDGWYFFNDERLKESELEPAFRKVVEQEGPLRPMIIEADERVAHSRLIAAWNAAMAAGVQEVSMATRIAATGEGVE